MKGVAPARLEAYRALRRVNAATADLPDAIASARERLADERDRALAAEIASGTLRWLAALDAIIESFAKRPVRKLDPEVLDVLRLSAYQLLHLDRVPASAVVHDAVELVRHEKKRSAAPFVNAVLRKITGAGGNVPLPPRPEAPGDERGALDYLTITLSHPRWLVRRWLERWGLEATERWARFNNAPAPLTLRVNSWIEGRDRVRERLAAEGVLTEPTRFAPDGLVVTAGNPLRSPLAAEGLFAVQDEASQLVGLAVGAGPEQRVLDLCAAPGGKTVGMAGRMADRGLIVSCDLRPRRVALLRATLAAARVNAARVVRLDATAPLPFSPVFDAVLLDAPCSGLGTIRRDPEIRWRRQEEDLRVMAATQGEMLVRAADVVAPGGRLVYATCSSEPDENEQVVGAFLAEHPEFTTVPVGFGNDPGSQGRPDVVNEAGHLRTWPHVHGLEAFFAAVLVKRH